MADDVRPVPGQNPDVAWAIRDVKSRAEALAEFRDYYAGRHRKVIPDGKVSSPLLQELLQRLRDNMCDDVVDEPVSRLEVLSWSSGAATDVDPESDTAPDAVGMAAQAAWDRNRGESRQRRTYVDMGWAGDAYNIVERDKSGVVRWQPQDPRQMAVAYADDQPDLIRVAAKVWREGARWRVNLYYHPDYAPTTGVLLERYASKGTASGGGLPEPRAFEPFAVLDADGQPDIGVREWSRCPVFHFPADEVGTYGRSVLVNVIPLQDLLNKGIADWVTAQEDVALPTRWGIGVQKRVDPVTGEELPIGRRPRRASDMLTVGAGDGQTAPQFGQFDAVDLSGFLQATGAHRLEIARKGYLPLSSVALDGGSSPTGLSLLVQEGRQVKRCKTWQRDAGWVWREQVAYMLNLEGYDVLPEDLDLEWANPTTRDEQARWELLTLKRDLGVPLDVILVEGGYDPDDVARWLEDAAADAGGRVSVPGAMGAGVASVTVPGMSGGLPVAGGLGVLSAPGAPAGAVAPGLSG